VINCKPVYKTICWFDLNLILSREAPTNYQIWHRNKIMIQSTQSEQVNHFNTEDIEGNVNKMDKNPVLLQLGLIFLPTQDFGL